MITATRESSESMPNFDQDRWQAWTTLELPEGCRAEIVEGCVEVSSTGRHVHSRTVHEMRDAMTAFPAPGLCAPSDDGIPDVFVAPRGDAASVTEDGLGIDAARVESITEVVAAGRDGTTRGRVRGRRAHEHAGVPVHVLVDDHDDHDDHDTATVLTAPPPEEGVHAAGTRVPHGTEVVLPAGPAKGFVVAGAIPGPPRGA